MKSTAGPIRRNVFVSHASKVDVTDVLRVLTEAGWHPLEAWSAEGPTPLLDAIVDLIRQASVLVGVMEGSQNVVFEAGIAVGLRKPVILLADESERLPSDLSSVRVITRSAATRVLVPALEQVVHSERKRTTRGQPRRATNPSALTSLERQRPTTLSSLERQVTKVLQEAGAEVVVGVPDDRPSPPTDAPDLVVWDDELTAAFGQPLPVELLTRVTSLEAIAPRLWRTLRSSGARSLLALHLDVGRRPLTWIDDIEGRFVLALNWDSLLDSLMSGSLSHALGQARAHSEILSAPK